MRILMVCPRLPHRNAYSGHQMVYQRMARLMERGHDVGLASFVDPVEDRPFWNDLHTGLVDAEVLTQPAWNFLRAPFLLRGQHGALRSFFGYDSPKMAKRIGEMVKTSDYDVVIAEFTAMGQFLYQNPYLPAVRKILSCHDSPTVSSRRLMLMADNTFSWAREWAGYQRLRRKEFKLYHAMVRVLALTAEEQRGLLEEDPTLRISTVSPGVKSDVFHPLPAIPKEHAVVITGRFSSAQTQYGIMWFLRSVWTKLRERDPNVVLYLVGSAPSPAMRHQAARDDRIFVTGGVDNLRPYLAKSKVYVCPILSGSGLRGKVLEAMAMELPVVTTSVGAEGIPVRMGDNAMVADTPTIMTDYIDLLLNDDQKANAIGKAARKTVEAEFTWEHSMEKLDLVLRDVVAKRSYHLIA